MTAKRFDPAQPVDAEARRLFATYLEGVADGLQLARTDRDKGLHDARKSIKKARALLKLMRAGDENFYRTENARLRDLARSLSGARDAAALVEAADRLITACPDDAKMLLAVRAQLAVRRDAVVVDDDALRTAIDGGLHECAEARRAMAEWKLPTRQKRAIRCLADGVDANLDQFRRTLKRASTKAKDEDFHKLRKAVKAHWTQLGLLRDLWRSPGKRRRRKVEALGERLGEHNDLAGLIDVLSARKLDLKRSTRLKALKLAQRSKKKRARNGLDRAELLFASRPKRFEKAFAKSLKAKADAPEPVVHALGRAHV